MTIEELQEKLLQAEEQTKAIQAKYDEEVKKNTELEEHNKRLTDYNNKLFMRVAEPVKAEEKDEPLTEEDLEQKQIENIRKLMEDRRN